MRIEFAKSLSGHDKNHIYLIVKKESTTTYLVNGTTHPIEKPKKKNQKHYQIIKQLPNEVLSILKEEVSNQTLKRAIKLYETKTQTR